MDNDTKLIYHIHKLLSVALPRSSESIIRTSPYPMSVIRFEDNVAKRERRDKIRFAKTGQWLTVITSILEQHKTGIAKGITVTDEKSYATYTIPTNIANSYIGEVFSVQSVVDVVNTKISEWRI